MGGIAEVAEVAEVTEVTEQEMLGGTLASQVRARVGRLARRLRQERPPHGLGLTVMSVLSRLHRLGPASPSDLASAEQVQPQTMTRVLATLGERGLVARSPHPRDGRQSVVAITDAGRDLLRTDRLQRDAWLEQAIATQLTPVEREVLGAVLPLLDALAEA